MLRGMAHRKTAQGGIGAAVSRIEDFRLLRGFGRYTDDHRFDGAAHLAILRSPYAHAAIRAIDTTSARAMPGVLLVLTARDCESLGDFQTIVQRNRADGSPMPRPRYRPLADGGAKFVGDALAAVVAETRAQARDAAEAILVEYDPLPAVTDAAVALEAGAPVVWPDLAPDNQAFTFTQGDRAATDAAFAAAARIVRLEFRISRVAAAPMEPRAAIGLWDAGEDRFTLISGFQAPHAMRAHLAQHTLRIPPPELRVISPDMGGAFGMRGAPTPEHALVLHAARLLGRPVRWAADRTEAFTSDFHARDNHSVVELALDEDGIFQALRIRTTANLGAYLSFNTPHSSTNNLGGLAGVYRTPHIFAEVRGAFTNAQPTAPYRGAGRPEATFAIERVIDVAAAQLGIDRVALRRRNLIAKQAMPFRTGLVFTYDSGDFARGMQQALDAADWNGFPARRAGAQARGKLRGIGIANAIEIAGGPQGNPNEEGVEIRFDPSGGITLLVGSHSHGQGLETAFRQVVQSSLGLPFDRVRVVMGDTDAVPHGRGTFGSRSLMAGGGAIARAADEIVAKGRRIAAHLLETAEADIAFEAGRFSVAGTDRAVGFDAIARAAYTPGALPPGIPMGLAAQNVSRPDDGTFPNGCHVAEVEVDPETGVVQLVNYVVADDVGTVVNPLLLKGQIHGGIAQGVGQVLLEEFRFDPSGQPLTASFMDYAMPRATDLPPIEVLSNPQPTTKNPLGVKGAGEAGTVGALPVVVSAVCDAIGVAHLDMPLTSERVWRALRGRAPGG
jgi:carbon-monoxide dehydrogenase large subunit